MTDFCEDSGGGCGMGLLITCWTGGGANFLAPGGGGGGMKNFPPSMGGALKAFITLGGYP